MLQSTLFELPPIKKDVVYTSDAVAYDIVDWLKPSGLCLDPCAGDGAFLRYLPEGSEWCEIRKGKDFFKYTNSVDWIIGNPPYSIFEDWLRHSFDISRNVAYLLPTNKVFQRVLIMEMINEWGGIRGMRIYGSGANIDFPFGFSVGCFWFQRGFKGDCSIILAPSIIATTVDAGAEDEAV